MKNKNFHNKFYIEAITILLPVSASMSVVIAIIPFLTALLARTSNPEESIAGYSIAFFIMMFVGLPHLRTQGLTIMFFTSSQSIKQLRKFLSYCVIFVTFIALMLSLGPFSDFLLKEIFIIENSLVISVKDALIWLIPFPGLMIIRMHLYGSAFRLNKKYIALWSNAVGIISIFTFASIFFLFNIFSGSMIAASSITLGIFCEVVFLAVNIYVDTNNFMKKNPKDIEHVSQKKLLVFFVPLFIDAILPASTQSIINATMGLKSNPDLSIASLMMALGIFHIILIPINGIQNTTLTLFTMNKYEPYLIRRFGLFVGILGLFIILIIAFISPASNLIFGSLLGAENELKTLSINAIKILSILPLVLIVEQFYVAYLISTKNTKPVIIINVLRLITFVTWLVYGVVFSNVSGLVLGAAGWTITLFSEGIYAWLVGKSSYNKIKYLHYKKKIDYNIHI
ncbi:MAG: hypothetical protein CL748_05740 [Chloroflexi bacterium]|nr:hypothetical protein [Chloroflexota bacterium]